MSEQVVFLTDPFQNANIFGNPIVTKICHNGTQWLDLIRQFNQALYNAITVGLIIGFYIGIISVILGFWYWKKFRSTEES